MTNRILLIEDDEMVQAFIALHLENEGYLVSTAGTCEIGLDILGKEEIDLILLDLNLPDGLEATAVIRSMDGEKSTIPIIALTADIVAGNIKEYTDVGMNYVCAKPLNLPVLLKAINTHLDEEIHTSIPQAPSTAQDRQARDVEDSSELTAVDASFAQVLDRVSSIVDQVSALKKEDTEPIIKMAGISADKLAELADMYEKGLIEKTDELQTAFKGLAENPADDEIRDKIKMLIHTLKGGGSTFGYHLVATVAKEADDLLKEKDTLEAENIDTLGIHVEALSLIAAKKISGNGGKAGRILLQGLKDYSQNT